MLSNIELAQIRSTIETLLPDRCTILSVVQTSDSAGGWTETAGTVATQVPCRLDFSSPGKEAMSSASYQPFKNGMVSMAYDRTITTANQVLMGGVTYNITGVNDNQSWIGVKQVAVERIP